MKSKPEEKLDVRGAVVHQSSIALAINYNP